MDSIKRKNSMFIVITGVIVAVGRFVIGGILSGLEDEMCILTIMAVVNYIALGFVLLFLYNDLRTEWWRRLGTSGMDTLAKKLCIKIINTLSSILLVAYFAFGVWYILILKTSDLNDAISIVALTISIAANGLVDEYGEPSFKLVLCIRKFLKK